ncbi:MAG: hypothetical protein Q9198_001479 [Flavoplaca austrocitrina]
MSLRSSVANGAADKSSSSPPDDGDLITELNGFCGFMSILSSMRYCLGSPTSYGPIYVALAFIPFGLFFDFMDGKVARWRKKSSLMGQELDSLADLVRFILLQPLPSFLV